MAKKICKAILDLSPNDYNGINDQAQLFLDGLYVETTLYATPPITMTEFKDQRDKSYKATIAAIDGGKHERSIRDKECVMTHWMMGEKLIPYINGLYVDNRPYLEKSGAKTSTDPTPVPPPDQPNISRVENGPEPKSVKIYLVKGVKSSLKKRSTSLYRIIMFEKEEDSKGIEIGSTTNSFKLIGYDVPENVTRYYAVLAQNTGGLSSLIQSEILFTFIMDMEHSEGL